MSKGDQVKAFPPLFFSPRGKKRFLKVEVPPSSFVARRDFLFLWTPLLAIPNSRPEGSEVCKLREVFFFFAVLLFFLDDMMEVDFNSVLKRFPPPFFNGFSPFPFFFPSPHELEGSFLPSPLQNRFFKGRETRAINKAQNLVLSFPFFRHSPFFREGGILEMRGPSLCSPSLPFFPIRGGREGPTCFPPFFFLFPSR